MRRISREHNDENQEHLRGFLVGIETAVHKTNFTLGFIFRLNKGQAVGWRSSAE